MSGLFVVVSIFLGLVGLSTIAGLVVVFGSLGGAEIFASIRQLVFGLSSIIGLLGLLAGVWDRKKARKMEAEVIWGLFGSLR